MKKIPVTADVQKWKKRRSIGESVQTPIYTKTRKFWDDFFAVVKNVQSPWRSRLFLPEYFSLIWTKAAVLTGRPIAFDTVPRNPEDAVSAEVMQEVLNYQLREPNSQPSFYKNFTTMVIDSLVTGTAFCKVNFRMKPKRFVQYLQGEDQKLDFSKEEVITRMARWCDIEPIEQTRIFFDPSATHPQTAQWIIIDKFMTEAQIKACAATYPDFYKNLDQLEGLREANDSLGFYNNSRNQLLNVVDRTTEDTTVRYIKVWECYERKYDSEKGEDYIEMTEIAGESLEIRPARRMVNWHNLYPIGVMYDYDRPHELWGIGEIEATQSIVRGMNDSLNHFMDNLNLANNTMIMRKSSTILEPFIIEPGGEVIYDGERPEQFRFPDTDGQSFQLVHNVLQQGLERASGISGYLAGTPSASIDKTRGTKGGVQSIIQSGQSRINYSQRQVGDFMEQVGRIWLSDIQQFFTEEFIIRLTDGPYERVAPEEIRGELDVFVQDTSLDPVSKAEEIDMILGMIDRLETALPVLEKQGKTIDLSGLLNRYLQKLGEKQPDKIIVDAPPPPPPAPPEIKKNVSITFNGETLPSQIQAELLAEQFQTENQPEGAMIPSDAPEAPMEPAMAGGPMEIMNG